VRVWPRFSSGAKRTSSGADEADIAAGLIRRRRPATVVALAVTGLAVLGGCGRGASSAPAPTASPTTRPAVPTTRPAVPTTRAVAPTASTTPAPPSSPKATPGAASAALIADWEAGDRAGAATVATAAAVAALFAKAYGGEPLNDRGCSSSFEIVCSWGPYAGASSADALYQITMATAGGSWYVSSVVVET
jgi:hypothetical protein